MEKFIVFYAMYMYACSWLHDLIRDWAFHMSVLASIIPRLSLHANEKLKGKRRKAGRGLGTRLCQYLATEVEAGFVRCMHARSLAGESIDLW